MTSIGKIAAVPAAMVLAAPSVADDPEITV